MVAVAGTCQSLGLTGSAPRIVEPYIGAKANINQSSHDVGLPRPCCTAKECCAPLSSILDAVSLGLRRVAAPIQDLREG